MKLNIKPDHQQAKALRQMASITLQRLETTDKEAYPSNTLIDYYESARKLMEALAIEAGIKIKGEGAHQELIEHIAKQHLDEQERLFLQQLREYRNRISYEGFSIHKNFILQNEQKMKNIIKQLQEK